MDLDLSSLPEAPATYEEAVAQIESRIQAGEALQRQVGDIQQQLGQLNMEITFYQGAAKALAPPAGTS